MSYWAPQPIGQEPVLLTVGDIHCSQHFVIVPEGRFQLRGTNWMVNNQSYPVQRTPGWAVAVAIIGFLFVCLFSLFFLLAKETQYVGYIDVTVTGMDGLHHTTRLPVTGMMTAGWVQQQVSQAQALSISA